MSKKVLIVEDSTTDFQKLETIVKRSGATVLHATDGKRAIELAQSEAPAVIFMDVNMVNMDGFEATRQILAIPACKDIPVVFVTSKGQKADQVWAKMLGGKGFVAKPYADSQIQDELNKFLA